MESLIQALPKVELHIHIEGTLEPELMFKLADRNNIKLPYKSVEEIHAAYHFQNLQSFLDLYYQGTNVLIKEQDFYDLTWAYLERISKQNVRHIEIFFDPQTHTKRGIPFATVINGLHKALVNGQQQFGITFKIIMCFLRDLTEEEAFATLVEAQPHLDKIIGVGLDSAEVGNPPDKFQLVYAKARELGLLPVAHAGEEGPSDYIWQALEVLQVKRIDHGVRCLEDERLVKKLVSEKIPLTTCPLSNVKLRVVDKLSDHPLKRMLEKGLCATVNSDDPAYFGGYIEQNFVQVAKALNLTKAEIYQLAKNGIQASFLSDGEKQELLAEVEALVKDEK